MSDALYFQWQNDFLRKSIYPLREMKLRDFLVYFREIELWKEYEHKDISGEVDDYREKKKLAVKKVVYEYFDHQKYFKNLDVKTIYAEYIRENDMMTSEVLDALYKFHKIFSDNLDKIEDKPRHESYFLSQRVLYWLYYRKEYLKKIASKQRRVDIIKQERPDFRDLGLMETDLKNMKELALKMIDLEVERLYAYTAALGKIEKRKQDLMKDVETAKKTKDSAEQELSTLTQKIQKQEELQQETQNGLTRLKSPPELDSVKTYFSSSDFSAQIKSKFADATPALLEVIGGIRKEMQALLVKSGSDTTRLKVIKNAIDNLSIYKKDVQKEILKLETDLRNMGEKWVHRTKRENDRNNLRDVNLKVVDDMLGRLADYYTAFEYSMKKDQWDGLIKAKEDELGSIGSNLSKSKNDAKKIQEQIDQSTGILDLRKRLGEYIPELNAEVKKADIVQAKADDYKASLMDLDHYELLQLVVAEFKAKPNRYPRWLQYMVIHFSGMRYASAHGSWADPKDLLANLRASDIQEEMKDDSREILDTECRKKLDFYEPSEDTPLFTNEQKPKLASVTEKGEWKDKRDEHIKDIKRALETKSAYHQRQALINLCIEEANYDIDQMPSAKVYEKLIGYKKKLPDWMWREIIRMTELRVTEVQDENWEKPQGLPPGYKKEELQFRTMLEDWKKKFLTGWRQEHDQSDNLIVTRAVCNEVAEHIQHLRGLTPGGGLTSKPKWYQNVEKTNPNAYFVKPETADDFKPGASILWLRFVRKPPNEWQWAEDIRPDRNKYEILPPGFGGKTRTFANGSTTWSYDKKVTPVRRWRSVAAIDGGIVRQEEFLRWMHEATVVETAKTADGNIVLTFETALPGDDPRLSTIGVFKRNLSDLVDDGQEDAYHRSFVGFIPEGDVPEDNLKDMLDWEKILYKADQQILASDQFATTMDEIA